MKTLILVLCATAMSVGCVVVPADRGAYYNPPSAYVNVPGVVFVPDGGYRGGAYYGGGGYWGHHGHHGRWR